MQWPYELKLGWRYTRAGRTSRRNGFISFISMISVFGIALGVAALIIVMSVMNGFQKDVRDKMLSVVSHIEIMEADGGSLPDYQKTIAEARTNKEIIGAAPFISAQALIARGETMTGVQIRGIEPSLEPQVSDLKTSMKEGQLLDLQPDAFGVILGNALASALGAGLGDNVTVVTPGGQMTPAGVMPRLKQLKVVGIFESGHYEYDSSLALIHVQDAQKIYGLAGPSGVRLKIKNLHDVQRASQNLANTMSGNVLVRDWTQQNKNWFAAVQVEKTMMFIILSLIVAVAAFNLVSSLVMTVTDKRADIAILRTLGATPKSIMKIFMVQGAISGIVGTLVGLALGLLVAFNVDVIVPFIENLFGVSFLPRNIYLISRMPSEPLATDIIPIVIISLALAFVATIYPSWRASRINPAEALRYE